MCVEKKTCACRHSAAAKNLQALAGDAEFVCPMSRGGSPPELGPNTKCDKLEKTPK